jgi:hypothetical protein
MKAVTALVVAGSLFGCASVPQPLPAPRLLVPSELTIPCDKPRLVTRALPADTARLAVEDARKLLECRDRHQALIDVVENFQRLTR